MTPERRAAINRRLADFDYGPFGYSSAHHNGQLEAIIPHGGQAFLYTADLNALARLEAKLPPRIWKVYSPFAQGLPKFRVMLFIDDDGSAIQNDQATEAEGRAEAIYLYLTSEAER